MIFQQIRVETTVIPHVCVISTAKFIYGTIFATCSHPLDISSISRSILRSSKRK